MPKEKVTLTLDADTLAEMRALVGGRSLSATVEDAAREHLRRLRHLAAVADWLDELEREDGPPAPAAQAWAAAEFDSWDRLRQEFDSGRRAG